MACRFKHGHEYVLKERIPCTCAVFVCIGCGAEYSRLCTRHHEDLEREVGAYIARAHAAQEEPDHGDA